MPAHCTKLMEKVSTTYKLMDGVLVKVMHIIKQRDRTCRYCLERECNRTIRIKATMMRSQWWLQEARRKMHPSTYDLLLLNLVRRATDRWLRSGGFCGEVEVLLSKGIQGFQPVEKGQHHSVLTGLVDAYVHDLLVHVDV